MATAGPAQADAGAATSNGQVSPPVADSGIAPASDRNPFYGKAQVVPPPPFGEDVDAPEPDAAEGEAPPDTDAVDGQDDALDLEGETQEGEAEADGEPEQSIPDVSQWATTLRDAPTRINEIPAKQRAEAIRLMQSNLVAEARQATQLAYQQGHAEAQQQAAVEKSVAEIRELRDSDADGFVQWQIAYPDRAAAFMAYEANQNPQPTGRDAAAAVASQQAVSIVNRLKTIPGAHEALLALKKDYYATPESVAELTADAAEIMAEARARQKANDPEARKASARQANAENIKGIPKPAGNGTGGTPTGELTAEYVRNITEKEVTQLIQTPEGEARLNRALARLAGGA